MATFTLNDLLLFLLSFFRIAGMMMFAPVFGSESIPPQLKIALSLVLTLIFYPFIARTGIQVDTHLALFVLYAASEIALGLLLGFVASLMFSSVQIAGQLVDQEIGLGMANVIDPISNEQVSILAQFKFLLAIAVYLALDGHFFMIDATFQSFQSVPLLGFSMTDRLALHISDTMVRDIFVMAMKIAAPAVVTLLLVTVSMAFMARIVPEMNIFILGFALRIIVGFAVLAITIPGIRVLFEQVYFAQQRHTMTVLELMGGH